MGLHDGTFELNPFKTVGTRQYIQDLTDRAQIIAIVITVTLGSSVGCWQKVLLQKDPLCGGEKTQHFG